MCLYKFSLIYIYCYPNTLISVWRDQKTFVVYGNSYEIVSLTDTDQWALIKLWFKEN